MIAMPAFRLQVLVVVLVLGAISIPAADATPPPYDGRAWYLLPYPNSAYYDESLDLGFSDQSWLPYDEKRTPLPRKLPLQHLRPQALQLRFFLQQQSLCERSGLAVR